MNIDFNTISAKAQDVFWQSVKANFPHIVTGDIAPLMEKQFDDVCTQVVKHWYELNTPKLKLYTYGTFDQLLKVDTLGGPIPEMVEMAQTYSDDADGLRLYFSGDGTPSLCLLILKDGRYGVLLPGPLGNDESYEFDRLQDAENKLLIWAINEGYMRPHA